MFPFQNKLCLTWQSQKHDIVENPLETFRRKQGISSTDFSDRLPKKLSLFLAAGTAFERIKTAMLQIFRQVVNGIAKVDVAPKHIAQTVQNPPLFIGMAGQLQNSAKGGSGGISALVNSRRSSQ